MSCLGRSFPGFMCLRAIDCGVEGITHIQYMIGVECQFHFLPIHPHPHYFGEKLKFRSKSSHTCSGWSVLSFEKWLGGISVRGRMVQVDKPLCLHDFGLPNQYSNPGLIAAVTQNEPLISHHKSSWLTFNVYQLIRVPTSWKLSVKAMYVCILKYLVIAKFFLESTEQ